MNTISLQSTINTLLTYDRSGPLIHTDKEWSATGVLPFTK